MNWRRGLLRLWIAATAFWGLYWLVYIYNVWPLTQSELIYVVPFLVGAPLAVLALGFALAWVLKGFR